MAVNVCPKCRQVTLSLEETNGIRCPICETEYKTKDDSSEKK